MPAASAIATIKIEFYPCHKDKTKRATGAKRKHLDVAGIAKGQAATLPMGKGSATSRSGAVVKQHSDRAGGTKYTVLYKQPLSTVLFRYGA